MNRFVAASASRGWTKTLFSLHSTLKFELPTATSLTTSLNSSTLRWFNVVASRVIFVRSAFCISIFWPYAARLAITTMAGMRFHLRVLLFDDLFLREALGETRLLGFSPR